MTQYDLAMKQAAYVANVFAAMFPAANTITCDMMAGEQIYVVVAFPDSADALHYLMAIGSDDEDYDFRPDDDNDERYTMPIRFPFHADDGDLPADDGSIEADTIIAYTISR